MGNDNKMTIHKPELKLFLTDSMYPETKTEPDIYDLEYEYGKTKKNKNYSIIFMFIALIVLVIGIGIGITSYINYQNSKIEVDINVFADTNLIELFDMVSRTEESLAATQSEKARIEVLRNTKLKEIEAKRTGDLYALENMRITRTVKNQREREIQQQYEKELAALQNEYDPMIASLDLEIAEYRTQLDSLDSSRVKQAQEQQNALDFQRQIYDGEKAVLQEKYETLLTDLRTELDEQQRVAAQRQKETVDTLSNDYKRQIAQLDPEVEDAQIDKIKDEIAQYLVEKKYAAADYAIADSDSAYNELLGKIEYAYEGIDYLRETLRSIPHEHSVPSILETIESIYYVIGTELSAFSSSEFRRLQNTIDENLLTYEENLAQLQEEYAAELEAQTQYTLELEAKKQQYEEMLGITDDDLDPEGIESASEEGGTETEPEGINAFDDLAP